MYAITIIIVNALHPNKALRVYSCFNIVMRCLEFSDFTGLGSNKGLAKIGGRVMFTDAAFIGTTFA